MNKKSLFLVLLGYVMWGILPLYWALLSPFNSLFVLANRLVWSAVLTAILLLALKKFPTVIAIFRDRQKMKYMLPASVLITLNWGVYIWAVSNGHIMDASLGYYMNPLAVFLCGMLVFKERCGKLELFALLLALIGVVLSTIQYGKFPTVALVLAITFAAYGTLKKFANVDALAGVCVETLVMLPLAIAFLIFSPVTKDAMDIMTVGLALLCVCTGVATSLPMTLYSQGVNDLPFATMGFLQYVSPTLMFLTGLLQGAPFTAEQGVSFGFIWAGLILFTIGMVRRQKALSKAAPAQTETT